ncbi:ABC transporter substrate-binding protein [Antrihabitans stalactiti]|uniref:Sugar ABC transporter substrate-binding protein n=1 Tax=Antrihabitans stalactiti TaxID=2584121 RepID=A0A848KBZ1_9NOCA|nr:sugar ABC transporter substrate-binding protein [Antrihabitans stalactiti]NMN95839.1 sugar ABC transporter substrate-binding protein [Antrihabitans stalactiti]
MHNRARIGGALAVVLACVASGCSSDGLLWSADQTVTVSIAIVDNAQMQNAVALSAEFERENPNIELKFVQLSENEARATIAAAVSTAADDFDVVMISNYETEQWAENGWLRDLSGYIARTPGYDEADFIPSLRQSLSHDGKMYSVPFYGESSFLMYRKDLFEAAGMTMPERPTWVEVEEFAARLDSKTNGQSGICLRGKPGWGEVLAPLNTVINTFGGRWYDEQWNAQLTSPEVTRAVDFYVDLVRRYGQPGAAASGYLECATEFSQGHAAMWYDSTAAVSTLEDPATSQVVGKVGYAPAPIMYEANSGWLYTWSLGIPASSENPDAAWKFASWMTSKEYIRLVGARLGWAQVPPGSRVSTYEIPEYQTASAAYGPLTIAAMEAANPEYPTLLPVPYNGIQFLTIPEFSSLGNRVSQQISDAIAGRNDVRDALAQSQGYAAAVGDAHRR